MTDPTPEPLDPAAEPDDPGPLDPALPMQTVTVTKEYPAHWPKAYCMIAMAYDLLESADMRSLRLLSKASTTSLWTARRAVRLVYLDIRKIPRT